MNMGKTSLQFQGFSSPSSAGWKGFRHFSLKHHKLVAAKFPFLSEPQIRSRVKGLWNKLPANKKEEYTYSPEKVRSPSPKKFLKLSPDLFSWSPSKPYSKPLSPANSQQVDSRPLKSSWRAYLDTSQHAREGQDKRNDEQQHSLQQKPGILVRHSENKDPKASSKSKAKKGRVTFQLFPRRELFATDGAPTDISQESRKRNCPSTAGQVTRSSIPRKDLFSFYETATESASKKIQESRLKDTVNNDKITNSSETDVAPVMTENEGVEECIGSSDEPVETGTQICKETGEVETVGGDKDESKMENETGGNEGDAGMECNPSEERSGRKDGDDVAVGLNLEECRSEEVTEKSTKIDPNRDDHRSTQHANASCQVESPLADVNNGQVPSEDTTKSTSDEEIQLPVCPLISASESVDMAEEERVVAEILTELGIIIAQDMSPERRKKAISKQDDQDPKSSHDCLEEESNVVEEDKGHDCGARSSHLGQEASDNEGSCDLRSSSGGSEARDNLDENNNKEPAEPPIEPIVTLTTESNAKPACTSQSDGKQETKRRGRPPQQKGTKSKVSNNNNTPAENDLAKSTNVPEASYTNDENSVRLISPAKEIASPPKETASPQNQSKLFHLRRSPRNLRRSPRLADLELQKMHTVYDIRKQLRSPSKQLKSPPKQSPRKQTNDDIPESPYTPPRSPSPEPPKFSSPEFRVYEFNDEPEGKPKFSPAVSPTKRLSPPGIQSCIVPQCPNSDEDDDNDDITSPVPVPQSPAICVSPAWVDSTAKRLINKGLFKNKTDKKKSAEEYNLDSINNALEFETDKTRSHRTPSKRKRKSQLPVSVKFAKKRRQVKKTATDLPKRKQNRKSKKQLIPPVISNDATSDASKAQNEEDELLQAISSLESESDPVSSLLPMSPEQLFEEQHDLFGEDVSSPLSLVKDAADSWMYRYYEHSNIECSSDSEDNFISCRKNPTAVGIDEPLSASQKLCKKFAEFCNNLSQSSSGSSIPLSNDDEEEEMVMELTLNAAALSPLYSMEDSEAYEADLPDVDSVTKLLCDVDYNDERQVESAALSALTSVLSSALDCLQDNNTLELDDTSHIDEDVQPQLPSSENPVEQEDNQTCENEKKAEVVNSPQQMQSESSGGDLPDNKMPNNQDDTPQENDTIHEQVPEGNANKAREQKEDEELEDINDQALKLSGITEESTTTNNSNKPPDLADATEAEIFLQDTAASKTAKSKGCIDDGPSKSSDVSGDDDLLCNLFHQISPSPPRASHIPTPRASGRRLIASNRVETVNNFGGLFEDEDIFM